MITRNAEEDLTVLRSPAIPYIDVENNVAPDTFHTFGIVNANVIPEGSVLAKPKVSANDRMVAKSDASQWTRFRTGAESAGTD